MKESSLYVCSKCDAQFPKWSGRCSECGSWGTLAKLDEVGLDLSDSKKTRPTAKPAATIDLTKINLDQNQPRLQTGIEEIDRVFGNGLVPGSLILIGGEPGIGKSTLVAQIADALSKESVVLYVSGEESAAQIKLRLERLHCDLSKIKFLSETNVETIIATARGLKPALVIVDSIQTVYLAELPAEAGSVTQIRGAAVSFLELAKENGLPAQAGPAIILTGHITKDGAIAGPKTLEHIVDTVLYLETDPSDNFRFLRATKNRFGSTNELGIFEMTATGLTPVANPTSIFLAEADASAPGSVISAVVEGTRPFLVEVQALVSKTVFGYPVRRASGFDLNRLQVLTAVLSKRSKVNLSTADVILNIAGGLKIVDPGLDLAVALAIASSLNNKPVSSQTLILGEVGLGGEVRPVARLEDKLKEAAKLNFTRAIIPANAKLSGIKNIEIIKVKNLSEALEKI
jgi:DNA repair protein RadA/Sms